MPIICPVCGKDDYMQKVSSIVFLGTSVGEFSGKSGGFTYSNGKVGTLSTTSSISGVTSTHLAQLLAAPRLPDVPAGSTFEKLLRVFGIFLGTSILLSLIPNFSVSGLIFPVIIIFISLYGWKNVDGKYKTRLDNWKIQKVRWESAMNLWNSFYYCSRDDVVFNPNDDTKMNPSQLQDHLYG